MRYFLKGASEILFKGWDIAFHDISVLLDFAVILAIVFLLGPAPCMIFAGWATASFVGKFLYVIFVIHSLGFIGSCLITFGSVCEGPSTIKRRPSVKYPNRFIGGIITLAKAAVLHWINKAVLIGKEAERLERKAKASKAKEADAEVDTSLITTLEGEIDNLEVE